jgi:predicted nucleic acid-binding protein
VNGLTAVIDTNIFVSARNANESGYAACRSLLDEIDRGDLDAIVSAVTIAEVRAGLSHSELPVFWQPFLSHLLTSPHYSIQPLDAATAEEAGAIRAATGLSLPDAIIVATARIGHANFLVTQDTRIGRVRVGVQVRRPDET